MEPSPQPKKCDIQRSNEIRGFNEVQGDMYPLFDQIVSACVSEVDQCLELAGVSSSSIPLISCFT